ncbi:hypothetical protein DMN91_007593 [Ooceraea biroi]|uniref:A-kinase anchor protein 2 C-terminal domain-containing protein n=1 Tax=Ooceraea biroi TaxID=2015173 RepID=A0A3L8DKN1_OOCBI|nr:hypothetical protein DMN91_007593 [Ooceraea biroi]
MQAEHRLEQLRKATDRIQREIEEVTEREHELRNVGSIKTTSHETVDSKVRRMPQALVSGKLKRTTSTPQILEADSGSLTPLSSSLTPKMTNGVISTRTTPTPLRFATAPSQRGLMHRFLATRGKIYKPTNNGNMNPTVAPTITLNPLSLKAFNKTLEIKLEADNEPKKPLARKGYVPVEQKIQKELDDMKVRENELRIMRSRMLAKSQPNLLDIESDNDSDIYDSSNSLRSGTSTNTLNEDEVEREHKEKERKSNSTTTTRRRHCTLIARWENMIAANRESIKNNYENDNYF